jgi:type II secretory pathway predicted ATPase ExeA
LTGFLTTGELKIPKQPERRERELRNLVLKRKKPVVLIVEERTNSTTIRLLV